MVNPNLSIKLNKNNNYFMKNQQCSVLVKEYHSNVKVYNEINKRIVQNKYEMYYLWKYKNDYPADWKRKAEMLSADRNQLEILKSNIIALKAKIRKCNMEHPQK
jgi:uncharacterized protein YbdZ (MbtH family)